MELVVTVYFRPESSPGIAWDKKGTVPFKPWYIQLSNYFLIGLPQ